MWYAHKCYQCLACSYHLDSIESLQIDKCEEVVAVPDILKDGEVFVPV